MNLSSLIFSIETIAVNNFRATRNNSDSQFFMTNETQLSLLKILYCFKTIRAQEELLLFEQPPQCSAVTRSISDGMILADPFSKRDTVGASIQFNFDI